MQKPTFPTSAWINMRENDISSFPLYLSMQSNREERAISTPTTLFTFLKWYLNKSPPFPQHKSKTTLFVGTYLWMRTFLIQLLKSLSGFMGELFREFRSWLVLRLYISSGVGRCLRSWEEFECWFLQSRTLCDFCIPEVDSDGLWCCLIFL